MNTIINSKYILLFSVFLIKILHCEEEQKIKPNQAVNDYLIKSSTKLEKTIKFLQDIDSIVKPKNKPQIRETIKKISQANQEIKIIKKTIEENKEFFNAIKNINETIEIAKKHTKR